MADALPAKPGQAQPVHAAARTRRVTVANFVALYGSSSLRGRGVVVSTAWIGERERHVNRLSTQTARTRFMRKASSARSVAPLQFPRESKPTRRTSIADEYVLDERGAAYGIAACRAATIKSAHKCAVAYANSAPCARRVRVGNRHDMAANVA